MKQLSRKQYCVIGFVISIIILFVGVKAKNMVERRYAPLSGLSIVLDPGHGGKDDGARASDVKEQEINLKISLKLKGLLETAGARVLLTRDGNYDLASEGAKNRKREDMKRRVSLINDRNNDMFLSIHLNAISNTSIKGAQAFYEKKNEEEKIFADIIQEKLNVLTGRNLKSQTGDYYILNNTEKVGALVECGFISNVQDRSNLLLDSYQDKLANALYESVLEYFDILDS